MSVNKHLIKSEGRQEVTYAHLYDRLMDFNSSLTLIERMLIASMMKEISVSPQTKIKGISFAADLFIDMERKQDVYEFKFL